jgi:hypothetical protein
MVNLAEAGHFDVALRMLAEHDATVRALCAGARAAELPRWRLLLEAQQHHWLARTPLGYSVLRYDDVVTVLRDRRLHSAGAGVPAAIDKDDLLAARAITNRGIGMRRVRPVALGVIAVPVGAARTARRRVQQDAEIGTRLAFDLGGDLGVGRSIAHGEGGDGHGDGGDAGNNGQQGYPEVGSPDVFHKIDAEERRAYRHAELPDAGDDYEAPEHAVAHHCPYALMEVCLGFHTQLLLKVMILIQLKVYQLI